MNRRRRDAMPSVTRCEDCGKKADAGRFQPIDRYRSEHIAKRLLCLGCLATRRLAREHWQRI